MKVVACGWIRWLERVDELLVAVGDEGGRGGRCESVDDTCMNVI